MKTNHGFIGCWNSGERIVYVYDSENKHEDSHFILVPLLSHVDS